MAVGDASKRPVVNGPTDCRINPFAFRNVASRGERKQGEQVAHYRVYCLDGANKVASAEWLEAAGDAAALDQVRKEHDGDKCELWDGPRLVAMLDLRHGNED